MRKITRQEAEQWTDLARRRGFINDKGSIALGRFTIEPGSRPMQVRLLTPMVAGEYTDDLQRKQPPVLFDRTATGEIVLPGRWWKHMFEKMADAEDRPADIRHPAVKAARFVLVDDLDLPADTDTIEMEAPDEDGRVVTFEALPPGTVFTLRITPVTGETA